jgi:hypothetical protein
MAPRKRTQDLIIQTTDGQIYAISADMLGDPVSGDPVGMAKLRKALAAVRGKAVGMRAAVMGYLVPIPVGENNIVTVIERDLARVADRAKPSPAPAMKKSARGAPAKKSPAKRKKKS